jgi:S-sulfosulfanyl-L-cysteine sulfohydrolase
MISRRDFLQMLAVAASASTLPGTLSAAETVAEMIYAPPTFGNLSLMHVGDGHGQLLPHFYREPSSRMGVGASRNKPPFLVGEHLLEHFRIIPNSRQAHALTHLNFEDAALVYGKVGGMAHLASVIKRLRASRRNSLLLDCGDSWQGSGLSTWTRGQDGAEISRLLGVDAMTGDWEFALGATRLKELTRELGNDLSFVAQNVRRHDDSTPFRPYSIFFMGGSPIGVVGLAYPHIRRFGAKNFVHEWDISLDEERLQATVDAVRARGVRVVVLLSHAGLPADLKLARRVRGINVILSGHSHDALPQPMVVNGGSNQTLVVSSGAQGKFIGLLDLDLADGQVRDYRYSLLPIFANLVEPEPLVASTIERLREPYAKRLDEKLATTEGMLYRRDTFKGSFDQLFLDILREARKSDIAIGPGCRWGASLLPGDDITLQHVLDHAATGQAGYFEENLTGAEIRQRLETWCDEVFNPDPYQQSGEDMVRASGLTYECDPAAARGKRIRRVAVGTRLLESGRRYKVVSWGVRSPAEASAESVWELVAEHLRRAKTIPPVASIMPQVVGAEENLGIY